jgi:1-acyl-sn-glycerol-3-phosphate acyltransferase
MARTTRRRAAPGGGDRPLGLLGSPSPRAPLAYRALLAGCRLVSRLIAAKLELEGAEHLPRTVDGRPAGGWIGAGLPHRTWVDPFVLALLLPREPRLFFMGDGRTIYRNRLRRFVFSRIGGVVPIWPGSGPAGFDAQVGAVRQVIDAGGVFVIFPEIGPPVPVERARPLAAGIGYFALRTGAPIVPLVLGGAHEIFRGRRIILRVLPPVTALQLAGPPAVAADAVAPEAATSAEREAAHRIAAGLHTRCGPDVADAHRAAEPPPGTRRRWAWLTGLFH